MGDQNTWTLVNSKKSNKLRGKTSKSNTRENNKGCIASLGTYDGKDSSALRAEIVKVTEILKDSRFYHAVRNRFQERCSFQYFVVLGVGNFSTSAASLLQIALAFGIMSEFSERGLLRSTIFDPQFSSKELSICSDLGFIVNENADFIESDEESNCLFLMPHCPYQLYNQVLWYRWGNKLKNTTIIGNR